MRREKTISPVGAERVSAGAYGSLIAASTLIGVGGQPIGTIIGIVVLTNLVYYATHVFAYSIGPGDGAVGWKNVSHHLRVSAPMLSAAFLPVVVVVIGTAFGLSTVTATQIGVIVATLVLCGVAVTGARLRGIRGWPLVFVATGTAVLAAALILAKYSLH
ncbi:hypothetical protein [Glaciibacter superstes]|uniref:hypothetical protein n=1 Tax=Glaciibacter superstes TaxID=501023 RepID=UPI0003B550A9|nr:hypothetical protein [Glaciibacter superstes]